MIALYVGNKMLLTDLTQNSDIELILGLHDLILARPEYDTNQHAEMRKISAELRDRALNYLLVQSDPDPENLDS